MAGNMQISSRRSYVQVHVQSWHKGNRKDESEVKVIWLHAEAVLSAHCNSSQ